MIICAYKIMCQLYQFALRWKYQHRSLFLPQQDLEQRAQHRCRLPHGSVRGHRTTMPLGYATPGEQSGHCTACQKQQRAESLVPAFAPKRERGHTGA
ncbi:hypothetical protein PAHAL_1G253900 [Panicum hallii]|uniref:Uncharacterized protein n=1 Tax=Panicum hallii TaxID=206008 RepID=A0A2T8KWB5_9POAL|nr:hypothetical protein PAHAL_1G253900 [Panicum hallii]